MHSLEPRPKKIGRQRKTNGAENHYCRIRQHRPYWWSTIVSILIMLAHHTSATASKKLSKALDLRLLSQSTRLLVNDLKQCNNNLLQVDSSNDGRINSDEYVHFIRLQSNNFFANVTSFQDLPLEIIQIFNFLACNCQNVTCCVNNDSSNASIKITTLANSTDFCSDVSSELKYIIPTPIPTAAPTRQPTFNRTTAPTNQPLSPTTSPTNQTLSPTTAPTNQTLSPTAAPTNQTLSSTAAPTNQTLSPTAAPTNQTISPTAAPTNQTLSPTTAPTNQTLSPTAAPTNQTLSSTPYKTPSPTSVATRTNAPATSNEFLNKEIKFIGCNINNYTNKEIMSGQNNNMITTIEAALQNRSKEVLNEFRRQSRSLITALRNRILVTAFNNATIISVKKDQCIANNRSGTIYLAGSSCSSCVQVKAMITLNLENEESDAVNSSFVYELHRAIRSRGLDYPGFEAIPITPAPTPASASVVKPLKGFSIGAIVGISIAAFFTGFVTILALYQSCKSQGCNRKDFGTTRPASHSEPPPGSQLDGEKALSPMPVADTAKTAVETPKKSGSERDAGSLSNNDSNQDLTMKRSLSNNDLNQDMTMKTVSFDSGDLESAVLSSDSPIEMVLAMAAACAAMLNDQSHKSNNKEETLMDSSMVKYTNLESAKISSDSPTDIKDETLTSSSMVKYTDLESAKISSGSPTEVGLAMSGAGAAILSEQSHESGIEEDSITSSLERTDSVSSFGSDISRLILGATVQTDSSGKSHSSSTISSNLLPSYTADIELLPSFTTDTTEIASPPKMPQSSRLSYFSSPSSKETGGVATPIRRISKKDRLKASFLPYGSASKYSSSDSANNTDSANVSQDETSSPETDDLATQLSRTSGKDLFQDAVVPYRIPTNEMYSSGDSAYHTDDGSTTHEESSVVDFFSFISSAARSTADTNKNSSSTIQNRAEIRAEVEALVRKIVPDEIDNVDEMMNQFKGREDELIETLRAMDERSIAQRERAARNKNAVHGARREARKKRIGNIKSVIVGQSPREGLPPTGLTPSRTLSLANLAAAAKIRTPLDAHLLPNFIQDCSPEPFGVANSYLVRNRLEDAIEAEDWEAVGVAAGLMSDGDSEPSSPGYASESTGRSGLSSRKHLQKAIEERDWEAVGVAAALMSDESVMSGSTHDVVDSIRLSEYESSGYASTGTSIRSTGTSATGCSVDPEHGTMLDNMIDIGDWSGVVLAAKGAKVTTPTRPGKAAKEKTWRVRRMLGGKLSSKPAQAETDSDGEEGSAHVAGNALLRKMLDRKLSSKPAQAETDSDGEEGSANVASNALQEEQNALAEAKFWMSIASQSKVGKEAKGARAAADWAIERSLSALQTADQGSVVGDSKKTSSRGNLKVDDDSV